MTVFIDGNGPGCACTARCEFPCWQRVGLTDQKCCAGCAALSKEDPRMTRVDKLIKDLASAAVDHRIDAGAEGSERYWEDKQDELAYQLEHAISECLAADAPLEGADR